MISVNVISITDCLPYLAVNQSVNELFWLPLLIPGSLLCHVMSTPSLPIYCCRLQTHLFGSSFIPLTFVVPVKWQSLSCYITYLLLINVFRLINNYLTNQQLYISGCLTSLNSLNAIMCLYVVGMHYVLLRYSTHDKISSCWCVYSWRWPPDTAGGVSQSNNAWQCTWIGNQSSLCVRHWIRDETEWNCFNVQL